jgi:hypothetical protein
MALIDNLKVKFGKNSEQIKKWMEQHLNYQRLEQDSRWLQQEGIFAIVMSYADLDQVGDDFANAYHFTPDVSITFRYDKTEKFDIGIQYALKTTFSLLSAFSGDAVLLHGDANFPVMLRQQNKLILSEDTDYWESYGFNYVNLPFEFDHIKNSS